MPINDSIATEQWLRYQYMRDNGHMRFVEKAQKCEEFFRGEQWDEHDLALLREQRRPAITLNKILSTLSNVFGEQIYNRSEVRYQPVGDSQVDVAEALTKVYRQISEDNQLDWKRSDIFADGVITSRGYLDVRLDFGTSMQGKIKIEELNPKNVIPDPDAEDYDPDTWNDLMITKWLTVDDIAILYSRDDAALLKDRDTSTFAYGYDMIDRYRDRFGDHFNTPWYYGMADSFNSMRNIRILERQHRKLSKVQHFVDPQTGDMSPIPDTWERNRISHVKQQFGLNVVPKLVKRLRWTVTADNVVLHDDWMPYKHMTVVPYFPYFMRGKTVGLVENLISPQELLNKATSQELHVINTTANSGWKVKKGSLQNMDVEELEEAGATTGLVLELNDVNDAEKITPNQTPQGLDRLSYKGEEGIKSISGVSDYSTGFAREDVAAKAVAQNQQANSTNHTKVFDNLERSDFILARNTLDLVQEFYTEPRLMTITHDRLTGQTEQVAVNQVTPEGEIVNDLTLGEYSVVVTSAPARQTFEEGQLEQAINLKKLGVQIPDEVLIENSNLYDKGKIIKQMQDQAQSPQAQEQQQLGLDLQKAEVAHKQGEAAKSHAQAKLDLARAHKEATGAGDGNPAHHPEVIAEQLKHQREMEKMEREHALKREQMEREHGLKREQMHHDMQLKREESEHNRQLAMAQAESQQFQQQQALTQQGEQ